jgi:hypothetical protein
MGKPLAEAIKSMIDACWAIGYHPICFRIATTVCLKKSNKGDYSQVGAWRPIALLSVVGKIAEKVVANRLRNLAEDHNLLPKQQMGGRKQRSTYSALELLTEQVHTAWNSGKIVVSLLSLDISGAFDTVSTRRLLAVLKERRIPLWIIRWVRSFMNNRQTTLLIQGELSDPIRVLGGAPQGSPISPILFLFYNAELIELCSDIGTTPIGFVDDANILAYGKSTAVTCRALEKVHSKCIQWASKSGMEFAPHKYELIHLTRRSKAFDTTKPVRLGEITLEPQKEVRILGVWLDPKLKWTAHLRAIKAKIPDHLRALSVLAASTWGVDLHAARLVYKAVVRPALAYGAPIWHTPSPKPDRPQGIAPKLATIQNQALRKVTGAYKATPTRRLELEAMVPPIHLYMDSILARHQENTKDTPVRQEVREACDKIVDRLRNTRRRGAPRSKAYQPTPHELGDLWIRDEWKKATPTEGDDERGIRKKDLELWRKWRELAAMEPTRGYYGVDSALHPKGLDRHKGLRKAESSMLIQMRTGVLGLGTTLSRLRVPGETEQCACGQGRETIEHFLIWCRRHDRIAIRRVLGDQPMRRQEMLEKPELVKEVARWAIKTKRFAQFSLAESLLYSSEG